MKFTKPPVTYDLQKAMTLRLPDYSRKNSILRCVIMPLSYGDRYVCDRYMTTYANITAEILLGGEKLSAEVFLRSFLACVRDRCLMISFAQPCTVCIENFSPRTTHY